jgi:hypothetical protein
MRSRDVATTAISEPTANTTGVSDLTRRLLEDLDAKAAGEQTSQAGGAGGLGGSTTLQALERTDKVWSSIRNMPTGAAAGPTPTFVTESTSTIAPSGCDYDVAVCGGTLGILAAAALQARGQRVAGAYTRPVLRST